MKKACKVAYFGWYSKYGDYAIGSEILASQNRGMLLDWVFTQQYIWELIDNSDATFLDGDIQNQYISFKNDVDYRMARIKTRPSFDATTIEVEAGETKVINDANGVLADYSTIDNEKDGVRFKHIKGENTLTITIPDTCSKESIKLSDATMKEWGLVKEESKDMDTTIYFALDNGAQDQIYALHYNDPVPLAFELKVNLTGNMSIKKLDSEKNLINGSIFNVTGPNGYNNDVTVVDGKILIEKLRKGTYTIKEKSAPKGYLINENTYTIEVKSNETTEQVVIDTEPTGKISISKTDSKTGTIAQGDSTLKDAVYKVYANEDIYNVAKTKKFYSKGDLVATRNTNDKGICEDVNDLPLGKYIVREEKAPLGYLLDTKQYDVNLSYKDQNTKVITEKVNSTDKVKEMRVHIFKSGIKENSGIVKGLEGAEFTIKLNADVQNAYNQGYTYAEVWNGIDENGNKVSVDSSRVAEAQTIAPTYETIKTDENGNAYTSSLAYGKYIVKETNTPKDFESAADFTFSITKDESEIADIAQKVKDIVVNNEQLESYIKLIKKDKITNKVVTLNNATFQIKATKDIYDRGNGKILYKKGEIIKQKIGSTTFDSFTTNAKNIVVPTNSYTYNKDILGSIMIPLKLEVGSYEITEIKTPTGFLKLENPVTFNVDGIRDYDTDKDGDFVKEVVIKNEQPTGTLNLDKSVAVRENVDTSFIDVSDLSGIQFKLVAKEDIKDMADGSNFYNKGQEICKYCLSKDGKLTIDKLPMGTYELQEIKTLDGLVLDDTKYEVKFTMKDNTTKVYTKELKVKNDTTLVSVSKQDITGQKELEGAKLTVLDNDKVIDTWTSTNKQHTIEGLVVGREYTLREEIAPDGYVKATDIKFTVKNTNEIQHVKMIDKIVTMSKVDIGGEEIEGAKIQILDKEGKIVDEWTSEKTLHQIKGLVENETYKMHEEVAVEGFVKATDVEFKVTEDKQTQHEVLVDKIVEITKKDITNDEEIEGAELEVIDEKGNTVDKWTSTKESHKVTGLEEGKTYKLVEKTAPYGYELTEEIEFTVTCDKETQHIEMKDKPILKNVRVEKLDQDTKEHIKSNKFVFGIYEDEACTKLIKEVGANKDEGTALFDNLRYGTYYIKEIKAPLGYRLSDKVVKIEINDKGVFADGVSLEDKDGTYSFEYYNSLLPIIQTGDEMNYLFLGNIAILSLAGIGVGIVLLKSKKEENNNKK